MAQGKMKVKAKLPPNSKTKKEKGKAITKRINAPVQSKKHNGEEAAKLKKMITKNVNKKAEEEIRSMISDKKNYSNAQKAVIAHNTAKTN